jgi:hypothetical protein
MCSHIRALPAFLILMITALLAPAVDGRKYHFSQIERFEKCGVNSDCLWVRTESGSGTIVQGLDFNYHTVADVMRKIPLTFASFQALRLGNTVLNPETRLDALDLRLAGTLLAVDYDYSGEFDASM